MKNSQETPGIIVLMTRPDEVLIVISHFHISCMKRLSSEDQLRLEVSSSFNTVCRHRLPSQNHLELWIPIIVTSCILCIFALRLVSIDFSAV
jgi:hypothetical protein